MNFDLVIYDLDGTLIDSRDDIADAVNLTLVEAGMSAIPVEKIYTYIGSGVRSLLRDAMGGDHTPEYHNALAIFRRHYLSNLVVKTCLYDGVKDVISRFHSTGIIKQAVATNKPSVYTGSIIERLGIKEYLEVVMGSDENIPLKPDPYMLASIIEKTRSNPDKTIMIGDGTPDILAARGAGIKSCAVGYGIGERKDLLELSPDFFIEKFHDLPKLVIPDYQGPGIFKI